MFKKQLLSITLLLFFIAAHAQDKQPYYYETISNKDHSIDFDFGFYTATIQYFEGKDYPPYTSVNAGVFYHGSKDSLTWQNYKIYVLLKSGKLISNYAPFSNEGSYACRYSLKKDSAHYQFYCFHGKFVADDISKIWLGLNDDEFFDLVYDKNDK
jgi:hypothetical protein